MKVLFVSSGNSKTGMISFVKSQGESLLQNNISLEYFSIIGKGFSGYFKNARILKKHLKQNHYNIIHAHYALSAWVALFASRKIPIVVSYMGSDTYGSYNKNGKLKWKSLLNIMNAFLLQPFVNKIIVKSQNLSKYVLFKSKMHIVPNGVNLSKFSTLNSASSLKERKSEKNILFLANTINSRKNFRLLKEAMILINNPNYKVISPYPLDHNQVQEFYNNADVFVLTSFNEGSPNVIKEAMACNCPIVATDVGDIRWLFGETEGCFITSFKPEDVAVKIQDAINFGTRTKGRERLIHIGLDSDSVAKKLINIYKSCIN
ncbi:MAG: glycosyltransferase family 4 protein [Bacteroidetes bacterium]|jgi:teichuronic acid biosynthesis glycosyltransferase TuaC|nr:glycosyltransferase family 4 protein [Bacteroidota bacterium]